MKCYPRWPRDAWNWLACWFWMAVPHRTDARHIGIGRYYVCARCGRTVPTPKDEAQ